MKIIYEFGGLQNRVVGDLKILQNPIKYSKPNYSCLKKNCYHLTPIVNIFSKYNETYFKQNRAKCLNKLDLLDKQLELRRLNTDGWWYNNTGEDSINQILELALYAEEPNRELDLYTKNLILLQELRWRLAEYALFECSIINDNSKLEPNWEALLDLLSSIGIRYIYDEAFEEEEQMKEEIKSEYSKFEKQNNITKFKVEDYENYKTCNLCIGKFPSFFVKTCREAFYQGEIRDLFDEECIVEKCLYCSYIEQNNKDYKTGSHFDIEDKIVQSENLEFMNRSYINITTYNNLV